MKKIIKKVIKDSINKQMQSMEVLYHFHSNDSFISIIEILLNTKGKIICCGLGKSGIIAQKWAATLNSLGSPSVFLHAEDAIHGDLGLIQDDDILICISKSGETNAFKSLIPIVKNKNTIISITSNKKSYLSIQSDLHLYLPVQQEADSLNLAPTTSSSLQIIIGDTIAVCLSHLNKFTKEDFYSNHPSGTLGKQLFLKVSDLSMKNEKPFVQINDSINDVINSISKGRLGMTCVLDKDIIQGIITDGDLRRMLEKNNQFKHLSAKDIMTIAPKCIDLKQLAFDALKLMNQYQITQLIVTEKDKYKGVIHLHDILNEGIHL